MIEVRRLRPATDEYLFLEAFRWLDDSPPWRRETEAVFGTLDREEFLAATYSPTRIDVGVFDDRVLTALVSLSLAAHRTYEVHFEAARGANPAAVIEAGISIRDQMFRYGCHTAFTWTVHWNRPVLAINKALGFRPSGVTMHHGSCQGRLIQWVQYSIRNPDV